MKITKSWFFQTFSILIGNFMLALGTIAFVETTGIIMGGATGIGLVLQHYLKMDLALCVGALNLFFFFVGYFVLGKVFALGTFLSTILFPIFLSILENIPTLQHLTNDMLLSTIFAGLFVGAGLGLVIRVGASTGGMDIPVIIMNKKLGFSIAACIWVSDAVILAMQLPFSSTEQVLYGIILLIITTSVMDKVMILGENQIQVMIISPSYEEISDTIQTKLLRGVTMMKVRTGYRKDDQLAVLSVISPRQLGTLHDLVQEIDPAAFVIITEIHSVKGRGFTLPDIDL